jgi:phytol kinase
MSSVPNSDSRPSTLSSNGSMAALSAVEARLGARELRRRLWHMTPGLLPFILWPIEHRDPISPTLRYIILTVSLVVAGRIFLQFKEVQRYQSENRAGAVLGYLLAVVGTLLLFPAQPELAFLVLAVLAFGDGSATLGGFLFRGPALPWNEEKTIAGTLSFLLCGTLMGAIIYWGESNPVVPFGDALLISGLTAFVAAFVESLPTRLDDNIRVGVTAALIAPLAHAWVIGF